MVTQSIIRHLLSDDKSLRDYLHGREVSFEDVKRRLLLLERLEKRHIPDHFYRMNQQLSLQNINTISDVFIRGLSSLADEYLEMIGDRIYVKQAMQNQWQGVITYISPLIFQTAFLAKKKPLIYDNDKELKEYYAKYIFPNFKYTALPHPYIPQLEHYITQQNGLHDLHMHLNGTTEMDIVWQSMLFNPQKNRLHDTKVKEQLDQENCDEYDLSIDERLLKARYLRTKIIEKVYSKTTSRGFDETSSSIYHPLINLFSGYGNRPESWMPLEGLMYVMTITELCWYSNECLAKLFHQYLLIQGSINRLLVHQMHQNGFEQFQKITLNELRSDSEKRYLTRFLQLHGNDSRNIKHLEGRFAPKKTQLENERLLINITEGWEQLLKEISIRQTVKPKLKLIAHFIKSPDDDPDQFIRHKKLRKEIWEKAIVLGLMIKNKSPHLRDFVGIDAASSEFDAPPEVFAPIFRMLRRKGVNHFTYHAGEDFYHIIGGLRAVFEAIEFNELSCGDRIGHGTAMGVSPKLWIDCIGDETFLKQGDYLDDLVFVYHLIDTKKDSNLNGLLQNIENKIHKLCYKIYNKAYPLQVIIEAWLSRKYCPMHLFATDIDEAKLYTTFCEEEWAAINELGLKKGQSEVIELLEKYHSKETRGTYEEILKVDTAEFFDAEHVEVLQRIMLEILHKKEIVIETLPTSNVRIGIHQGFETYHLWNWIKWQNEGHRIPPIIIGTDDAGIFSTNIYNEFANIYCYLTSNCKMNHNDVMQLIESLDKNGRIYSFDNDLNALA